MTRSFLGSEMVVRCPHYTVGIVGSKRMVGHVDGRFICGKSGPTPLPADPEYRCSCDSVPVIRR